MGVHQWHVPPGDTQLWLKAPRCQGYGGGWRRGRSDPSDAWTSHFALHSSLWEMAPDFKKSNCIYHAGTYGSASTPDMRSVSLLKAHRFINVAPISFADLHDDGELEYQRTLAREKNVNLTSAGYYLHFSCWVWHWTNDCLNCLFALVPSMLSACF